MTRPTDAEKILLKVVDLQAKHMDNSLSMCLYQINTKELLREQKTAYVCKWLNAQGSWTAKETDSVHDAFEAGWAACWQALCTIAETQGER